MKILRMICLVLALVLVSSCAGESTGDTAAQAQTTQPVTEAAAEAPT